MCIPRTGDVLILRGLMYRKHKCMNPIAFSFFSGCFLCLVCLSIATRKRLYALVDKDRFTVHLAMAGLLPTPPKCTMIRSLLPAGGAVHRRPSQFTSHPRPSPGAPMQSRGGTGRAQDQTRRQRQPAGRRRRQVASVRRPPMDGKS